MSNPFDEIRSAMSQAKAQLRAADSVANDMAELLIGRLENVSVWRLAKLKKELSRFDAHRKVWK
jgi:hypothetical protein